MGGQVAEGHAKQWEQHVQRHRVLKEQLNGARGGGEWAKVPGES